MILARSVHPFRGMSSIRVTIGVLTGVQLLWASCSPVQIGGQSPPPRRRAASDGGFDQSIQAPSGDGDWLTPSTLRRDARVQGQADSAPARNDASREPAPPAGTDTIQSKVLLPIEIELPQGARPDQLPPGAEFEHAARTVYWVPKADQGGTHQLSFEVDGKHRSKRIKLAELSEERLDQGPPGAYEAAAIGYVFVHGKGDVDRCRDREELAEYWDAMPTQIAPEQTPRTLACYNGRRSAVFVAPAVAQQILDAPCGKSNRCIVVTHSMGGLVLSHIMTHARAARGSDPEPALFEHHELYRRVQERVLFVIAVASAAGGSKAADIVVNGEDHSLGQQAIGHISKWFGQDQDSTESLVVDYATRVAAPIKADPGVPFFMVPGFSPEVIDTDTLLISSSLSWFINWIEDDEDLFNGDAELAALDAFTNYRSRSDGLVSLRSGCGIASGEVEAGPGHDERLSKHLRYCYQQPKKPRHHVWFLANLNHFEIIDPNSDSRKNVEYWFPDAGRQSYVLIREHRKKSTGALIRELLTSPRNGEGSLKVALD